MNTIQDTQESLIDPEFSEISKENNGESEKNIAVGTLLGTRYEILEVLGVGGFGAVYKAKDLVLDEIVAIKVLDKKFSSDKITLERFKREIKLARKITHKNVVRIFDIDEVDSFSIISMEYVQGLSLKELLKKEGKLKLDRTIEIGMQICSALHIAHKNGVIHRDIKPQNILINNKDVVKIVDFGIARSSIDLSAVGSSKEITKTGVIIGTPEYISPEQVDGSKALDQRTDIFSVGIVLYEMLTGNIPFKGNTPIATILKRVNEDPVPITKINPKLPSELDRIIVKTALAKNANERYQNILELSEALNYLKEAPSTPKDSKAPSIIKTSRLPARIQREIDELGKEGSRLFTSNQFKESAEIWENILELDPRNDKASHFYKRASLKREDVIQKFKDAQNHYRKGSYRACIKLLEEVISLFKDHNDALNLLEKARKQLNKKGDKRAGVYAKRHDFRTTSTGFKITCVALFILTGLFLYLQYAMNETPVDGYDAQQPQIQNKNINVETIRQPLKQEPKPIPKNQTLTKKKEPRQPPPDFDTPGYLTVTDPKLQGKKIWAKIYIDGKFYNYTPQAKIKLKPGQYRITLEFQKDNSTYKKENIINVKPGEKRSISTVFTESDRVI